MRLRPAYAVAASCLMAASICGKTLKNVDPVQFTLKMSITDVRSVNRLEGISGSGSTWAVPWKVNGQTVYVHNNSQQAVYDKEWLIRARIDQTEYELSGPQLEPGEYSARFDYRHVNGKLVGAKVRVIELLSHDKHSKPIAFIYQIEGEHAITAKSN